MPPFLLTYAPVIAVVTAAVALFILGSLKLGPEMSNMPLVGLAVVTSLLAALVFMLDRRARRHEKMVLQSRQTAERMQSMLATVPGGYCLFTPQGLLRETV